MTHAPITKMNRFACDLVAKESYQALLAVAEAHGLSVRKGSGAYSDTNFTVAFEFSVIREDGTTLTKEVADFYDNCRGIGLTGTDLGREFGFNGTRYKVVGMNSRSKRPILAERVRDGKVFMFGGLLVANRLRGEEETQ